MKAIYVGNPGPKHLLALREVDSPPPPAGSQVLVRVKAAGLNRADLLQARGLYPPPAGYSPNIPGLEFAGTVEAVGQEASGRKIGDRVFGITAGEAQAELLLTDARVLARIPDNLDFYKAAAVPEAFITAHDALFTLADLKAGETLLIHAVGSGVGLAALQLAKANGVFVIGTSRTKDKLQAATKLGLDAAVDTGDNESWSERVMSAADGKGANVILDLVGAAYFEQNMLSLAARGRLILVGLTSGRIAEFNLGLALQKRATIIGTVLRPRSLDEKADATRKFIENVLPLLADERVTPNVDKVFEAANAAAAYKYLESNASFGKVILEF